MATVRGGIRIDLADVAPKIIDGYWHEWVNGEWVNTGQKATGDDGTNYLILGLWSNTMRYQLSDAGIPTVEVPDGTSLGYSVYSLKISLTTAQVGKKPGDSSWNWSTYWKLVESVEFIHMQDAFIKRLQFETARGGGFEIDNGKFISIKKDISNYPALTLDGTNGSIKSSNTANGDNVTITDSTVKIVSLLGNRYNWVRGDSIDISQESNGKQFAQLIASPTYTGLYATSQVAGEVLTRVNVRSNYIQLDYGGVEVMFQVYINRAGTGNLKVIMKNLPNSSAGLESGQLWRDASGFLRVV